MVVYNILEPQLGVERSRSEVMCPPQVQAGLALSINILDFYPKNEKTDGILPDSEKFWIFTQK